MEHDELATVYSVKSSMEAEIIRGALESQGIRCRLDGEGQAGLSGIFDIQVLVRVADEDQARAILESYERKQHEDEAADEPE